MPRKTFDLGQVQIETAQAPPTREPLYAALTKKLRRKAIAFYSSFDEGGAISSPDAEMIEQVIVQTKGPPGITLLLHSPGGDGIEAERIVRVCRKLSGDDFEVIVPRSAKSAATLVAMGANRILMSETSELGPVDPQVPWPTATGAALFPTRTLVEAYDDLMVRASKTKGQVEPFLQQLQIFNPGEVRQWRTFEALTRELAITLLQCHQMNGESRSKIANKIKMFTESGMTLDHSRPIFPEEAQKVGLKISTDESKTDSWNLVRELHVRCSLRVHADAKICESKDVALGTHRHHSHRRD